MKWSNMYNVRAGGGAEAMFENTMAKNFPKIMNDSNSLFQGAQTTPQRIFAK